MSEILGINEKKCTGCRLCELACSFAKTGEFAPSNSRIKVFVFDDEMAHIPLACQQCSDAPCIKSCPTWALSRDGVTGIVMLDDDKCIGCKMCVIACPFGVMGFDESSSKAAKCDNCNGDPACVKVCEPEALFLLKSAGESGRDKARDFASKLVEKDGGGGN